MVKMEHTSRAKGSKETASSRVDSPGFLPDGEVIAIAPSCLVGASGGALTDTGRLGCDSFRSRLDKGLSREVGVRRPTGHVRLSYLRRRFGQILHHPRGEARENKGMRRLLAEA